MPNPENVLPYRLQKGETANPHGRPKGSKNLSTILREMLQKDVEIVNEDGSREKMPLQYVLVRRLIRQAVNHDNLKAIQEIFDRVEGKPQQSFTLQAAEPLEVKITVIDSGNPASDTSQSA
jgi:hypothetical protein